MKASRTTSGRRVNGLPEWKVILKHGLQASLTLDVVCAYLHPRVRI